MRGSERVEQCVSPSPTYVPAWHGSYQSVRQRKHVCSKARAGEGTTRADDAARTGSVRHLLFVLDRSARSLGLAASSPKHSPAQALVRRALSFVRPTSISDREDRLLLCAEQLAVQAVVREQAYLYLALAACSFAANDSHDQKVRNAAFAVALGCASLTGANPRVALGVEDRLLSLADDEALDVGLRRVALDFEHDGTPYEASLVAALDKLITRLERKPPRSAVTNTTSHAKRKQR
jgi:hypothetical protein